MSTVAINMSASHFGDNTLTHDELMAIVKFTFAKSENPVSPKGMSAYDICGWNLSVSHIAVPIQPDSVYRKSCHE